MSEEDKLIQEKTSRAFTDIFKELFCNIQTFLTLLLFILFPIYIKTGVLIPILLFDILFSMFIITVIFYLLDDYIAISSFKRKIIGFILFVILSIFFFILLLYLIAVLNMLIKGY